MYVQILEIAAKECQDAVADALRHLLATEHTLDVDRVRQLVVDATRIPASTEIHLEAPDLCMFDSLLPSFDKECPDYDQNGNETRSSEVIIEENRCDVAAYGATEGAAFAEDSRLLSGVRDASSDREFESSCVSVGTGDDGVRIAQGRPHQTSADEVTTSIREDLGFVRLHSTAVACGSSYGVAAGWIIPGSSREHSDLRTARLGEESCPAQAASFQLRQHVFWYP
ncbi:MAG: hypothetical protein NT138_00590 [Planctomycetales bacterium]|nr:hypothetical protein [Planctomycetales bacterium]